LPNLPFPFLPFTVGEEHYSPITLPELTARARVMSPIVFHKCFGGPLCHN